MDMENGDALESSWPTFIHVGCCVNGEDGLISIHCEFGVESGHCLEIGPICLIYWRSLRLEGSGTDLRMFACLLGWVRDTPLLPWRQHWLQSKEPDILLQCSQPCKSVMWIDNRGTSA